MKLQEQINEIEKLNTEVIAIATAGNQHDVEKSKKSLKLTYTLIPTPNRDAVEKYQLRYDASGAAYATIIIDKRGFVRFRGVDRSATRTTTSKIIKELQVIQ